MLLLLDYVNRLLQAVVNRRHQLKSYKIAKEDILPSEMLTPAPLTNKYARANKEELVANHKTRFNKE